MSELGNLVGCVTQMVTDRGLLLTATMKNGTAMINRAGFVTTDIDASNGVIHVIDSVMLPPPAVKTSHATQAGPK